MQRVLPLAVHKHHTPVQSSLRGEQDAHQASGGVHRKRTTRARSFNADHVDYVLSCYARAHHQLQLQNIQPFSCT